MGIELNAGPDRYNLQKALQTFLKEDDAAKLAPLLSQTLQKGTITHKEAQDLLGEDPEDMLILSYQWRLLLPIRAAKAGDWEDRMMLPQPGETYHLPNVARYLIKNAAACGLWDPEKAIREVFRAIGEPDIDKMVPLVEGIASHTRGHRVTGLAVVQVCKELGLAERVDPLVSELKACGILSHKLGALNEATRAGTMLYEINPSLLVGSN
jgi:hypothetical protein